MTITYEFKTEPLAHQLKYFLETRHLSSHAAFWEQGTGKSKFLIDTGAWLCENDKVDGWTVVANKEGPRNWVNIEIPKHLPDRIKRKIFLYESYRSGTKKFEKAFREFLEDTEELPILSISYDAIVTKRGEEFVKRFHKNRRIYKIMDECKAIKTWGIARTKTCVKLGKDKNVLYKREAEGTPVGNKIFDLYSQIRWLDGKYWEQFGLYGYTAFKHFFGIWKTFESKTKINPKTGKGYEFDVCVSQQNIDRMRDWLQSISSRVLKDDCLDLPPKLYQKKFFRLTKVQEKMYKTLEEELKVEIDGEFVTAKMALVMLLRKQQITCGYLPVRSAGEESDRFVPIEKTNRRLEVLEDILEDTEGKGIIWSRYVQDCELICQLIKRRGEEYARYDGTVDPDTKEAGLMAFQDKESKVKWFVATQSSAAECLTMTAATTVVYYTNCFSLTKRLQSEDRAHRIGQEHPVTYIDIVAVDTVDEDIVQSLRGNKEVSQLVLGDQVTDWI